MKKYWNVKWLYLLIIMLLAISKAWISWDSWHKWQVTCTGSLTLSVSPTDERNAIFRSVRWVSVCLWRSRAATHSERQFTFLKPITHPTDWGDFDDILETVVKVLTDTTRWYPRGIQILVSTYDLPDSGPRVGGGGYSGVKTENTQSVKKCLNFNFRRGVTLESKLKKLKMPRNA